MKNVAGRKKHSAEDVVRQLQRADELAAAGKTNEEIAAELEMSPATLYNSRHGYGACHEPLKLRSQAHIATLPRPWGNVKPDRVQFINPTISSL